MTPPGRWRRARGACRWILQATVYEMAGLVAKLGET